MSTQTKLSININEETGQALARIVKRRSISYTEAIRRAVAIYGLIENEAATGARILIRSGDTLRELTLLPCDGRSVSGGEGLPGDGEPEPDRAGDDDEPLQTVAPDGEDLPW
jgi:hypothetical protein